MKVATLLLNYEGFLKNVPLRNLQNKSSNLICYDFLYISGFWIVMFGASGEVTQQTRRGNPEDVL